MRTSADKSPIDPLQSEAAQVVRSILHLPAPANGRDPARPKKSRPPSQLKRQLESWDAKHAPQVREAVRELGRRHGDKNRVYQALLTYAMEAVERGELDLADEIEKAKK